MCFDHHFHFAEAEADATEYLVTNKQQKSRKKIITLKYLLIKQVHGKKKTEINAQNNNNSNNK